MVQCYRRVGRATFRCWNGCIGRVICVFLFFQILGFQKTIYTRTSRQRKMNFSAATPNCQYSGPKPGPSARHRRGGEVRIFQAKKKTQASPKTIKARLEGSGVVALGVP
jgi:hypothetical protein